MAKKKTTKVKAATTEPVAETKEDVKVEAPLKTTTTDQKCIEMLKVKFEGNQQLAEKRLRYIKAIDPAPETDEEVMMLVKRYLDDKPLTINHDKVEGPVFSKVE